MISDDQFFLANAYIDGELTADERAIAEADLVVLAAVEELRVLRANLRDVGVPSESGRQRAIAVALDQFRVTAPLPVRSFTNRSYQRYIGIAAAVVAIGVLGVVLANTSSGGDDEDAGDAGASASDDFLATASDSTQASTNRQTDDLALQEESATGAAEATAGAAEAAAAVPEMGAMSESAATELAATGDASAKESAAARSSDNSGFDPSSPLTNPTQLALYAEFVQNQRAQGTGPITPETRCVFPGIDDPDGIIAATLYVLDGIERDVLVAVDPVTRQAFALDPDTCQVLVEAPLP